ncbi:hypothetical protein E2C01_037526 [Portunus trituberculatus]|uniref:Uncharacterized protein n=1 Tax=Portunus trituberculatus TaxID=210409 RepID=A0A5B7FBN0_PORTR|nr:hypothetical protein [Portunus trituberculatus]
MGKTGWVTSRRPRVCALRLGPVVTPKTGILSAPLDQLVAASTPGLLVVAGRRGMEEGSGRCNSSCLSSPLTSFHSRLLHRTLSFRLVWKPLMLPSAPFFSPVWLTWGLETHGVSGRRQVGGREGQRGSVSGPGEMVARLAVCGNRRRVLASAIHIEVQQLEYRSECVCRVCLAALPPRCLCCVVCRSICGTGSVLFMQVPSCGLLDNFCAKGQLRPLVYLRGSVYEGSV